MKRILTTLYMLLLAIGASAQFYVTGDDPGRLKWYYTDTENFRIIYPEGNDSLAKVYGGNLEKFRPVVGKTTGYQAGGPGRLRMPVMMHSWNTSNGSVAWAPKRMDLFTIPSAYEPEPMPWEQMLAVHESRHITQMQFGMTKAMKPFNWFFGEMWNILVSVVYPGISTMEGDAVITETAYTSSGRGRTSDFLNYYRVASDNGLRRNWAQWRFDSQRNYGPDYYSLGYLTVSGIRHFYNCPDYMSRAYDLAARRPYRFGAFRAVAKEVSGKKRFNDVFMEIADTMAVIWKAEADARAPYMKSESVTEEPRLYTDYGYLMFIGNDLYSQKSGHLNTPALVRIDIEEGKDENVAAFSAQTGKKKFHGNRIFWSESIPDERWTMETHSRIRYMTGKLVNGTAVWSADKSLGKENKLLYNPTPSNDGKRLACIEYFVKGGSALNVLDASDGRTLSCVKAPDGMQMVETAWMDNTIYASGISVDGYGIYKMETDEEGMLSGIWETVLEPQPVMIRNLDHYENELTFVSDRTGVNELYHLETQSGRLTRKTSLRHGGEDFTYSPDGEWLYYTSQTVKGKHIYRTRTEDLFDFEEDFTQRHKYLLAEAMTAQEKAIKTEEAPEEITFSEPRRYRKFPNMFNVHSWAPVYVNVDNIMNSSFDMVYQAASLGATGIIQNRLSTAVGEFGYSAHKDPYNPTKWRHSGHARFTYSGLYPVIEASVDFNDRAARQYNVKGELFDQGSTISVITSELPSPYFQANIKAYIPFNFSSGGWYRGVIPQLSYTVSNDFFNTSISYVSQRPIDGYDGHNPPFIGATEGTNRFMQYINGSIRAYTMMGTPNSAVYPRWGVGMELGAWTNTTSRDFFSPMGYAYMYGYIPGFIRSQGMKLSAMVQMKLSDSPFGQNIVNVLPRGLSGNGLMSSSLVTYNDFMMKFTADYAIPIYIGDISVMGSFLYLKRLVATPHFDYSIMGNGGGLFSAGGTLAFDLESILWLEWPCTVGVTASFNGGTSFKEFQGRYGAHPWYVGPTFNVSF